MSEDEREEDGNTVEPFGDDADRDPDVADLSTEDVADLSTDELIELSGGGYVDADGNPTAFPAEDVPNAAGDGSLAEPEEPDAEESAEQFVEAIEEISRQDTSTHQELFTDAWVAEHTTFDSIEAFLAAGPWDAEPGEGLWDVPVDALDEHAAAHSPFDSWAEMTQAAGETWVDETLDL